ncbi:MAG: lipid-A-disaccharide synthase [Candidatus Azobacteroides sp.]|nr:lipid-A-disaccharide synthase [Candidatus Azobacteroides sp.]
MKYYLISGEASGDLHASNLMKSLKRIDKEADFRFFGGDLMQSEGGVLVKHYRELAYMGFIPVILHLKTILNNLRFCKNDISAYQPDVVILVDYPGFNLQIAQFVKERTKIPVVYYISPKIWAWKGGRIKAIRKYVDRMLCIFPFEVSFYQRRAYPVVYVGNPTVDAIADWKNTEKRGEDFTRRNHLSEKPIIALLPGSRKQEIKSNLPSMLAATSVFPDFQSVIGGAPGIRPEFYQSFVKNHPASVVFEQTYDLLQQSKAALVTSGTATLETALLRVPQAVCYKMPFKHLSGWIWRHFFKVKYISLVNLIADRPLVRELFNEHFSEKNIRNELTDLLYNESYIDSLQAGYEDMINQLGAPGASERAAQAIVKDVLK